MESPSLAETRVPPGSFEMGSVLSANSIAERFGGSPGTWMDEFPRHPVRLSREIRIGTHLVTVAEFAEFVANCQYVTTAESTRGAFVLIDGDWRPRDDASWRNPYFDQGDGHPVVCVSWIDAVRYCDWLSDRHDLPQAYSETDGGVKCDFDIGGYRLPTEAEWEYAASACGKHDVFPWDDGMESGTDRHTIETTLAAKLGKRGEHEFTSPAGAIGPNAIGLYDMCGNVWQYCWDRYDAHFYALSEQMDPTGPAKGETRVRRGGSWSCDERATRVSVRRHDPPESCHDTVGFRVARTRSRT